MAWSDDAKQAGQEKMIITIIASTVAFFIVDVNALIDAMEDNMEVGRDNFYVSVRMHVSASDGANERVQTYSFHGSDTTSALVKAMLTDWGTGIAAVIVESDFDAVVQVWGTLTCSIDWSVGA